MLNINADLMERQFIPAFSSSSDNEEEMVFMDSVSNVISSSSKKRTLSKLPSMRESSREAKWEKRRRQILYQRRKEVHEGRDDCRDCFANNVDRDNDEFDQNNNEEKERCSSVRRSLTDEDFDELKGSIELGFGFSEDEGGHNLCNTLPALDLYFAVNRQFSDPKILSPSSSPLWSTLFGSPSPRSPDEQVSGSSKICSPGDDPMHVKTRLRHWAQAVACSVRQCSG